MQKIIPNIWFNDNGQDAAAFYAQTFKNASVGRTSYYTDAGKEVHGHKAGDVLTVEFAIEGMQFVALNGGPQFPITPAISFFVQVKTAGEVDELFNKLADGGQVLMQLGAYPFAKRYGWVSDKFGVSWQIILVEGDITQPIIPSLMFTKQHASQAEEAMQFYTGLFPQSNMNIMMRYSANQAPDKEGTIAYAEFSIFDQRFGAMDSAQQHDFTFSEAVSLQINCADQAEVDDYWTKLSADPQAEVCGWLKDKFGVSWQIVPNAMNDMMRNGTPEQIERVTAAFMQMKKINVAELQRIYNQK